MIDRETIEIWNLTDGKKAVFGSVSIFNIVGRIKQPETVSNVTYDLNGAAPVPIYVNREARRSGRLRRPGDFNVDTIDIDQLRDDNALRIKIARQNGKVDEEHINFPAVRFAEKDPKFALDLDRATTAEEVGQIVEGSWRIDHDEEGRRCLEIRPEDAGYDRIILFGQQEWSTNYELFARLSITKITGTHNLGFVFKWNPHERGDGTYLPRKWSSGLAYYCSYGKKAGLRLRFGVDVHRDQTGRKQGDYLLGYKSTGICSKVISGMPFLSRFSALLTDLKIGQDYCMRLRVTPERYAFTTWLATESEPEPQVVVDDPDDRLPRGSVGLLALQIAVRLYDFEVRPISPSM